MLDRLRNLPTWLRVILIISPFLACIPIACILVVAYQQYVGLGTSNAANSAATVAAQTATALSATQGSGQDALLQTESALATEAQVTADAAAAAEQATGTAAAQVAEQLALTQTTEAQLAVTPTETASAIPATAAPTAKPTLKPGAISTATPKTVTVTLRECRGDEGTVLFGQALPQSLHSFASLSFTVAPGTYHLTIKWLGKPQNNVDTQLEITGNQTFAFGDQCQ